MSVRRVLGRAIAVVGVTVLVVAIGLGAWAWKSSLLPDEYNVMGYGRLDYGGAVDRTATSGSS